MCRGMYPMFLVTTMMKLQGKNVYLAMLAREDCYALWENYEYDESCPAEELRIGHSPEKAYQWYDEIQQLQGERNVRLGIFLNDGSVIGDIALQDMDRVNRCCSVGMGIAKLEHRGRGYGQEAVRLMLDYGFTRLGMERITANTLDLNTGARRSLERCGFVLEGRERRAVYLNGEMHDRLCYAILREEFMAQRCREAGQSPVSVRLAEKSYPPILRMEDTTPVTRETWEARRAEMRALLQRYSYGVTPDVPVRVSGEITDEDDTLFAGKVLRQSVSITVSVPQGVMTFPVEFFVPRRYERPPVFLHLAFRPYPDRYIPAEEITDAGYALAVVCYERLVNDNHFGDYSDGIAALFGTTADRAPDEWGKIGMWAWGASRVLDYITEARGDLDAQRVAVIGHSRLGKTALWCGALDERFAAVISNNSGYGGAASSRHGTGERVRDFLRVGSWDWYCESFKQFTDEKEDCKPYDQSYLLALIAPRLLCVGSAVNDRGADPAAEFLTALHASAAWELLGVPGLRLTKDTMPVPGDHFINGCVGYHLRDHGHALSREDWNAYIRFLDRKWRR